MPPDPESFGKNGLVRPFDIDNMREEMKEINTSKLTPEQKRELGRTLTALEQKLKFIVANFNTTDPAMQERIRTLEAEQVGELWQQVLTFDAKGFERPIAQVFKSDTLEHAHVSVEKNLDLAKDQSETKESNVIVAELQRIAKNLFVNPEDVRQGDEKFRGSYYLVHASGKLIPNLRAIDKDRAFLQSLLPSEKARKNNNVSKENYDRGIAAAGLKNINPGLQKQARELLRGLDALKKSGPKDITRHYEWYKEQFGKYKTDWRPIRGILVVFGAIVTTLGLIQMIRGKAALSPATLFWAFVTAAAANPSMFGAKGKKAAETLAVFDSEKLRNVVSRGFHGPEGALAYQELQDVFKDKEKRLRLKTILQSRGDIRNSDIAGLSDDPNSPLIKILKRLPKEGRRDALILFASNKANGGTVAMTREFIEGAPMA